LLAARTEIREEMQEHILGMAALRQEYENSMATRDIDEGILANLHAELILEKARFDEKIISLAESIYGLIGVTADNIPTLMPTALADDALLRLYTHLFTTNTAFDEMRTQMKEAVDEHTAETNAITNDFEQAAAEWDNEREGHQIEIETLNDLHNQAMHAEQQRFDAEVGRIAKQIYDRANIAPEARPADLGTLALANDALGLLFDRHQADVLSRLQDQETILTLTNEKAAIAQELLEVRAFHGDEDMEDNRTLPHVHGVFGGLVNLGVGRDNHQAAGEPVELIAPNLHEIVLNLGNAGLDEEPAPVNANPVPVVAPREQVHDWLAALAEDCRTAPNSPLSGLLAALANPGSLARLLQRLDQAAHVGPDMTPLQHLILQLSRAVHTREQELHQNNENIANDQIAHLAVTLERDQLRAEIDRIMEIIRALAQQVDVTQANVAERMEIFRQASVNAELALNNQIVNLNNTVHDLTQQLADAIDVAPLGVGPAHVDNDDDGPLPLVQPVAPGLSAAQLVQIQQDLVNAQGRLGTLTVERDGLNVRVQAVQNQAALDVATIQQLNQQVIQLTAQVQAQTVQVQQLTGERNAVNVQLAVAQHQRQDAVARHAALENNVADGAHSINVLEAQIAAQVAAIEQLRTNGAVDAEAILLVQQQIAADQQTVQGLQQQLDNDRAAAAQLNHGIVQRDQHVLALQTQINQLNAQLQQHHINLQAAHQSLQASQNANTDLQDQFQDLRAQFGAYQQDQVNRRARRSVRNAERAADAQAVADERDMLLGEVARLQAALAAERARGSATIANSDDEDTPVIIHTKCPIAVLSDLEIKQRAVKLGLKERCPVPKGRSPGSTAALASGSLMMIVGVGLVGYWSFVRKLPISSTTPPATAA